MKWSAKKISGISIIILFSIFFVISFIIFPDVGEKVLYGKHPPGEKSESLKYNEIIATNNYSCMESASLKAGGDFSRFLKEFNECNS